MESQTFRFMKGILALTALLMPIMMRNPEPRNWYEQGYGWPLFYGWKATDVRPRALIASISDPQAFLINLSIGITLAAIIWFLPKAYLRKQKLEPGEACNAEKPSGVERSS